MLLCFLSPETGFLMQYFLPSQFLFAFTCPAHSPAAAPHPHAPWPGPGAAVVASQAPLPALAGPVSRRAGLARPSPCKQHVSFLVICAGRANAVGIVFQKYTFGKSNVTKRQRTDSVCVQQFLHENGSQLYSHLVCRFVLHQGQGTRMEIDQNGLFVIWQCSKSLVGTIDHCKSLELFFDHVVLNGAIRMTCTTLCLNALRPKPDSD